MKKIYIENLGCPKNIVDSERLLGVFSRNNYKETKNPDSAQIVIINTCGFIEASREESINTIFDYISMKERNLEILIVTGCLVESNGNELQREIPEIDYIVNLKDIQELFRKFEFDNESINTYLYNRKLLNKTGYAYLKVSDGCNKKCSFCTIPLFKGKLISRSISSLVKETEILVEKGVQEINLVAQDLTEYGSDINTNIVKLLGELNKIEKLKWIRLLYTYPTLITDDLINIIADSDKICSYIDIPFQHMDNDILRRMNRKGNRREYYNLIENIRKKIPNMAIRSTFIVGFPGETNNMYKNLYNTLKELELDRVGVFSYSYEEDTISADLYNHVDDVIKEERKKELMELQEKISEQKLVKRVGKNYKVLIDEKVKTEGNELTYYLGRSEFEAPEIDGNIVLRNKKLEIGKFYKVKIIDSYTHDLYGIVDK